jgi:hypothetical protein
LGVASTDAPVSDDAAVGSNVFFRVVVALGWAGREHDDAKTAKDKSHRHSFDAPTKSVPFQ